MDDTERQSASSPCLLAETDENLVDRENSVLIEVLEALLSAERAGARIAKDTLIEIGESHVVDTSLLQHIRKDELRYCQLLMTQLRRLGVAPHQKVGDFYEKCMVISDIEERLEFLNRGQQWVVKKIEGVLSDSIDVQLLDALTEMKNTHVHNIKSTASALGHD